ncbi:uncharacterized protein I303_106734 [Kwoniella dejecticola CBS 10117]|uniref:Uncharacterized protein n=1 Tax=Kwoniella dejecticola CBS 10117 TaxID=1296121 RepID=A0AAJ8MHZ8_9TREE
MSFGSSFFSMSEPPLEESPSPPPRAAEVMPQGITAESENLPAPRKTSSPLSSPSSSARSELPRLDDTHDGHDMDLTEAQGEMRSPATSSTLPLTDEEDEDNAEPQGDDESDLTEEEDDVEANNEEGGHNDGMGKMRQPLFPSSRHSTSRASSASLTPPPSDRSILSSPQQSPKITLKLNAPQADDNEEDNEEQDEEEEEEEEEVEEIEEAEEDDEEEEGAEDDEGDVTMRAGSLPGQDITEKLDIDQSGPNAKLDAEMPSEEGDDEDAGTGEERNPGGKSTEMSGASTEDPSLAEDGDDQEEREETEAEENNIVLDDDEVDIAPPVEIEVEVEEPTAEGEGENAVEIEEEQDEEDETAEPEAADSPAYLTVPTHAKHSSHAPPPTTANMRALVMLELKFAALRDRLYIERMEEAAAEEEMILNGTHPALQYLHKTLSDRREKLHEIASRRHQQTLGELKRVRESEKHLIWSSWTDDRDRLHWEEFEHTWSKRRRIAREKNDIETARLPKPVPKAGQPSTIRAFDWSSGATPSQLRREDGNRDLALMDGGRHEALMAQQRQQHQSQAPSRHAAPATYKPRFPAGSSSQSQPVNGGATIYSYPQNQNQAQNQKQNHNQAQNHKPHDTQSRAPIQQQPPPPSTLSHQHQLEIQASLARPHIVESQPINPINPVNPSRLPKDPQSTQPSQAAQLVQRRVPEGRTVPTTSDFFGGPRREPSTTAQTQTQAQKVKSPEEDPPMNAYERWQRGWLGLAGRKPDSSGPAGSPKTSSSLGNTPTLSNNQPPSNSLHQQQGRPDSGGTSNLTNSDTVKRSPTVDHAGTAINGGPIRSNSAENPSSASKPVIGGPQPPRSNSNPNTSTSNTGASAHPNSSSGQNQVRNIRDIPGNGIPPNPHARERPDFPSRFASLADYLASSTAPPGTGLFGMGLGMGMGMGMGGMGIGVPLGAGNKGRSPFQNGNANGNGSSSPSSNANANTSANANSHAASSNVNLNPKPNPNPSAGNRDAGGVTAKPTSPIPPPPVPPPAGTATIAGTTERK